MPNNFRRNASGFSLIELLLVLAIIAGLAVAAFIIYPRVQAGRQASSEAQMLSSAQAGIKALYISGDFAGLSTTVANQANFFPDSMETTPTTITNTFGNVTLTGATSAGAADATAPAAYFRITYVNVPSEVCIKLAAATAQNFGAVFVGSGTPPVVGDTIKNDYTGFAYDPILIPVQCTVGPLVRMVFVSN